MVIENSAILTFKPGFDGRFVVGQIRGIISGLKKPAAKWQQQTPGPSMGPLPQAPGIPGLPGLASLPGQGANRHPEGSRLLPARRDPEVRPAAAGGAVGKSTAEDAEARRGRESRSFESDYAAYHWGRYARP